MANTAMHSYVALLRGINVGGQKKIRMQELRDLCESISLEDVATYVQSGNLIFSSTDTDPASIASSIERAVRDRFGFEVPVFVRTRAELEEVAGSNPFAAEQDIDENTLAVVFLADRPTPTSLENIKPSAPTGDRFEVAGRHIYLHCPGGFARTKLSNNFFENRMKLVATTRNWKTVNALGGMLNER
jgi:uncharacterized protein (DUF1697 family)